MAYQNFKSFEELSQSIKKSGDKWIAANSNSDVSATYKGQWAALIDLNDFLTNERNDYKKELDRMRSTYAPQFLLEKERKLAADLEETAKVAIEKAKENIKALGEKKQAKVISMLTDTPTAETVRLLNVLQMRGNLDQVEAQYMLPSFFGNYQAMKVFTAVCEQNGVRLTMPAQLDCRAMFENIKKATEYLLGACNELYKPKNKREIKYSAFFTINPNDPVKCLDPVFEDMISVLDAVPQLQDCKTEKTALTPVEQAKLDWYYRNTEKLTEDQLIMHTEKVLTDHPEIKDMLQYTPYAKHLEIIAIARAEGQDEEIRKVDI